MGEVERVLQLAKDGKIGKDDAVKLLIAISGHLKTATGDVGAAVSTDV